MTAGFHRIEARIADRDELKDVAGELTGLGTELTQIATDTKNTDEAALLLARERIKTTSQRMRKGLRDEGR
jgi:hypothetical protein